MTLDERLKVWKQATDALAPSAAELARLERLVLAERPRARPLLRWWAIAALGATVVVGGALKLSSTAPEGSADPSPGPAKGDSHAHAEQQSDVERLGELMINARALSEAQQLGPPREKLQCALDFEAEHDEESVRKRPARLDEACATNLAEGGELERLGLFAVALERYEQVSAACSSEYRQRALEESKDVIAALKQDRGEACLRLSTARQWAQAEKACEAFMRLACQTMSADELSPPPGLTVRLEGGNLSAEQWRPTNPQYLNLLLARQKLKRTERWLCPAISAFRPPSVPPDPAPACKQAIAKRYPDPAFGLSIGLYFDGKQPAEFQLPLQKAVLESNAKAALHDQARRTLHDLGLAFSFAQRGLALLNVTDSLSAQTALAKALELDEQFVLGPDVAKLEEDVKRPRLERCSSALRRQVTSSAPSLAYQQGRALFDRGDFLSGCQALKVGYRFSRTHSDLLRAIDLCTRKAEEAFAAAQQEGTCEAYKVAWTYAVPGDGYDEKVRAAAERLRCAFSE